MFFSQNFLLVGDFVWVSFLGRDFLPELAKLAHESVIWVHPSSALLDVFESLLDVEPF